jgi:molecular chaperone DnaK
VGFDIDANGIVNVSAKDMATGKEQKITISGSSGLSKDEVSRLVKEAESHASEDQARRDLIDARNQADSLAYQVEKTINENRGRVPEADASRIESAVAEARRAAQGEDLTAIRNAVDQLQRVSHGLAEQLYRGAQGQDGPSGQAQGGRNAGGAGGAGGADVKEGEVVDAEYAETSN